MHVISMMKAIHNVVTMKEEIKANSNDEDYKGKYLNLQFVYSS